MDIQVQIAAAKAAITSGHWERAEGLYRAAVEAQPQIPEIHFNLANLLASQGRKGEAVESYQQALRVRTDYLAALNNLGNLLSKMGRHREAVAYLRRAVERKPDYSRARTNLVITLFQLAEAEPDDVSLRVELGTALRLSGRLGEAEAAFRAALVLNPKSSDAQRGLAEVLCDWAGLASTGDGAAKLYREALELQPGLPAASQGLAALISVRSNARGRTCADLLSLAKKSYQAGDLTCAVELYQEVLGIDPLQSDAWHSLGVILCQMGRHEQGIEHIREAVRLKPDFPTAHNNLGQLLREQQKLDEAVACFRQALEFKPDYADAYHNLGFALNLQHQSEEAIACYRRALALKPDFADAHYHLGIAVQEQQDLEEAVACYKRSLELRPDFANVHWNLGNALKDMGKLDEALPCYRRALELQPDYAEAHNNLGTTLQLQLRLEEAVACYQKALQLKPDYADAHSNLGIAFTDRNKLDEAITCFHRALALKPDFANAHMNLGMAYLLRGQYEAGWPEYAWRWQAKKGQRPSYPQPLWDGADLKGKTILIHAEQGLGDSLQFVRYLPVVQDRGARVIFACPTALKKFFAHLSGVDEIVVQGERLSDFDLHSSLLSLPHLLNLPQPADGPKPPYLAAQSDLITHWRCRLEQLGGFKVGINWQGNPKYQSDRKRSIPLAEFSPLVNIPGVTLVRLQQGHGSEQLQDWPGRSAVTDLGSDVDKAAGAFMDTAAIVQNLDLVITSDTALPHLAGAMGCPVWVALPTVPDWRWGLHGESTDWYPSMRLYRQTKMGQWRDVFERMAEDLRQLALVKVKNSLGP